MKIDLEKLKSYFGTKTVIHCDTEEKANDLLGALTFLDWKWISGGVLTKCNNFDTYGKNTCYCLNVINNLSYGTVMYWKNSHYNVVEFDDLVKGFKVKDLKFGNVVQLRHGALCILHPKKNTNYGDIRDYLNKGETIFVRNLETSRWETDLNDKTKLGKDSYEDSYDIVKVYKDYTLKEVLWEEEAEPILDEIEKNYLSAVIKPFRNKIEYIRKENFIYKELEYLYFNLDNNNDSASLPNFKAGTMYKGMELDKKYTLEELGL